jgi:hypothetical protein
LRRFPAELPKELRVSAEEIQVLGWVLALSVCGLSVSWLILLMEAFFHDKRIGFACVFGGFGAALAMGISEKISHGMLMVLAVFNLALIGLFAFKNFRKPLVYIPLFVLVISVVALIWVWRKIDLAGLLP